MLGALRRVLPILAAVSLIGCGSSSVPVGEAGRLSSAGAPALTTSRLVAVLSTREAATPASAAAEPAQRGDSCRADADCGWDDPCRPQRCGAVAERPAAGCGKDVLRPGTCSCVEQQCTLRPAEPTRGASAPGCKGDAECAIDIGAATCHLGIRTAIGPIAEEGPVCTCAAGAGRCEWGWAGPVPCKSWRDCSWAREPRLRPVPASDRKRPVPHPVKPCEEGHVDSVCGPQGTCRIVI
jgi:hypothetical protein